MRKLLLPAFSVFILLSCSDNKKAETSADTMVKTATANDKPMQSEFADAKYADMGKQMMMQMENGNMDAWIGNFADNAVYQWSSGDSLAGKKAIGDYWSNRRKNVMESIHFAQDIWLPIKSSKVFGTGPDVASCAPHSDRFRTTHSD